MNKRIDGLDEQAQIGAVVGSSRTHESAALHVSGEATYIDDIAEAAGTLHAALGLSPVAHGRLLAIDLELLKRQPGVVAVYTAADFPGENNCGPLLHDDPILAEGELRYLGQPVFAIVATQRELARRAAALAGQALTVEVLPPVLTALAAHAAQQYVLPPMHLSRGDAPAAFGRHHEHALDLEILAEPAQRDGVRVVPRHSDQPHGSTHRAKLPHPAGSFPRDVLVCRGLGNCSGGGGDPGAGGEEFAE